MADRALHDTQMSLSQSSRSSSPPTLHTVVEIEPDQPLKKERSTRRQKSKRAAKTAKAEKTKQSTKTATVPAEKSVSITENELLAVACAIAEADAAESKKQQNSPAGKAKKQTPSTSVNAHKALKSPTGHKTKEAEAAAIAAVIAAAEKSEKAVECGICLDDSPADLFYLRTCGHVFCRPCLTLHLQTCVNQSISKVLCPQPDCKGDIAFDDALLLLADHPKQLESLRELLLRRCLVSDPEARFCPTTGCPAVVISGPKTIECPRMECPIEECGTSFCYLCRSAWHEGECPNEPKLALGDGMKPCPKCRAPIEKNDGCNEVKCRLCGTSFCWFCGKTDISGMHFMGRGACPMYATKRKPRRWVILRFVLMYLFGFPVAFLAILLLMFIALPVIPIYLAVQFYKQEKQRTENKAILILKTFLVTLCLVLMSPLAVIFLAFTLILIAFVYIYCGRPLLLLINLDFLNRPAIVAGEAATENM